SRQRDLVAVDIRIPDGEPVTVGRYNEHPAEVTAAEAVARIRALDDPRGWEVFLPRGVSRREVHRVRGVSHGVGWRYKPDAHGTRPCTCMGCRVNGAYGTQRLLRRPFAVDKPPPPVRTLLARLERTDPADAEALVAVLDDFCGRRRGPIHLLAHLAEHPDPGVRLSLVFAIRRWRTPGVAEVLARLAADDDPEVREWATED
ncbi:MAG TPA: HEAT repeat domain-containing protein, partial [Phytomonospora sp.]